MKSFVDVREPQTKKLLFRYDPERDIIEVQRRGIKTLVDLRQYQQIEVVYGLSPATGCFQERPESQDVRG